MRFRARIARSGTTATGFEVPSEVVDALGSGKRPAVSVTINGFAVRTTLGSMSGRVMVPLAAGRRATTGVAAGGEVDVDLELDTVLREVIVPDDFTAALAARRTARKPFDALAYSHRKEHVRAIEDATTAATRERRIDKAVEMSADG